MLSQEPSREAAFKDAILLSQIRQGDPEAWRAVAVIFRQQLRDLAESALPAEISGRLDASDMAQETLADANKSFAGFRGSSLHEFYVWLAAILNHNISDAIRQHVVAQRRTVKIECRFDDSSPGSGWDGVWLADQTSPSMVAARGEVEERLRIALEGLPPRQREAVRLRHLEGRPLADIAFEMSCTMPAAAAAIARGLRALRSALQGLD